jgi:hypothetical protein
VELYLFFPYMPSWLGHGKTLHFCINLDELIKWVVGFARRMFLFAN